MKIMCRRWPESSFSISQEFAEVERDRALGVSLDVENTYLTLPAKKDIPDKSRRVARMPGGLEIPMDTVAINPRFYRDYAEYEFARNFLRPSRLVVTNVGTIGAEDVRVVLHAVRADGMLAMDASDVPHKPQTHWFPSADISGLRRQTKEPGDVEVVSDDELSRVEVDCGVVQPGRRVWSEKFYLGLNINGAVQVRGEVFATNLPEPASFNLTINANTVQKELTLTQLVLLADRAKARD